jgi:GAF domain-containing protein
MWRCYAHEARFPISSAPGGPTLDHLRDLLVLFGHLREAVLPQAFRPCRSSPWKPRGQPPTARHSITRPKILPTRLPDAFISDPNSSRASNDGATTKPAAVTTSRPAAAAAIAVPMLKDNELVGAITFARQEVRMFTDQQIELIKNFAAQAGSVCGNRASVPALKDVILAQGTAVTAAIVFATVLAKRRAETYDYVETC